MRGKRLLLLSALGIAVCWSAVAADLPMRPSALAHRHPVLRGGYGWRPIYVGVEFGLVPGLGQLGAAAPGYYGAANCWRPEPAYDVDGNYYGQRPVNLCLY
jgi:hypothetical protein